MDWPEIHARISADRNDTEAWPAVEHRVRTWAQRQLREAPWHVVDDVVADTCSTVAVTFDRARCADTFAGFVFGCYLNERRRAVTYLKRIRPSQISLADVDQPEAFNHALRASDEEQTLLLQALSRLPARERTAVTLRHLQGLPSHEIAVLLGVRVGNARQIIYKGMEHLRASLCPESPLARAATT